MRTVILVLEGEYEDRRVWLVADTRSAALDALKRGFPSPPNKVVWGDFDADTGEITGTFEFVLGHHGGGKNTFSLEEHEVVTNEPQG